MYDFVRIFKSNISALIIVAHKAASFIATQRPQPRLVTSLVSRRIV